MKFLSYRTKIKRIPDTTAQNFYVESWDSNNIGYYQFGFWDTTNSYLKKPFILLKGDGPEQTYVIYSLDKWDPCIYTGNPTFT